MKILLDTHIIIWLFEDSPKLPQRARELVLQAGNEIYYSTLSLWEIEVKRLARPDKMPLTAREVSDFCKRSGYRLLNLKEDSIYRLGELSRPESEPPHKDPFDKMLICQAVSENMCLLTHDALINGYTSGNILFV